MRTDLPGRLVLASLCAVLITAPALAQPVEAPAPEEDAAVEEEGAPETEEEVPAAEEEAPAADEEAPPVKEPEPVSEPAPAPAGSDATLSDPELPKCERAANWGKKAGAPAAAGSTLADDLEAQAERAMFEAAADRYALSAQDYQAESHAIFRASIDKQKDFVRRTYGKKAAELEVAERQRRAEAIERFERFIEKYPDNARYTPDAMFRLAELYFERSGVAYADAEGQYSKDRDLYERGKIPSEPVFPQREYKDTVRMYRTMLARFGQSYRYTDAVYYLLGYVLEEQEDDVASREAWKTLVERFPKSDYAAEVWLRVGEMHFDYGEFEEAAAAYKATMAYDDQRFYDKALYKLGWTYFQLYDYDNAIRRFKELIGYYDKQGAAGESTASALREEAIDYLAGSLAEDDWDNDGLDDPGAGVARALAYLSGGEPFERDIIKKYGETLKALADKKKWGQAIKVYRHLLQMDPLALDAPDLQMEIILIHDELRDIDGAARERRKLADLFGVQSKWWEANRDKPAAQVRVSKAMEDAMRNRALWHHQRAQELKVQAGVEQSPGLLTDAKREYLKAATAYEEYLVRYPNEPATYEMTFFLAETYWYSDQFERAAPIYRKVSLDNDNTKYRDAAAWSSVKAYEKMLAVAAADGRVPAKAVPGSDWQPTESEGESTELARVTPELVPEQVMEWVRAVDFYVEKDFKQDGSRKPQADVSYQAADILFRFKNYEEARKRFAQVISCHPREEVAAYAAANIINSYRDENDWANLEKWANIADRLSLGNAEQQASIRRDIKVFKLGSLFKRAEALYADGKFLEAGREFKRLADQNPDAAFADKAYFNAASAFKKEGYYDSAAEIFEKLVTDPRYQKSEFAEDSLFELAETNKLFFNFDKAINAYLTLYERYSESDNRRYAWYTASVLQEQSGDPRKAAKGFERYAGLYRDRPEAAGTLYRAAELWKQVGDEAEETRLLELFIDRYDSTPGMDALVIGSMSRLADMAKAGDKKSRAARMWKEILREYLSRGQQPGSPAAVAAAKAEFELTELVFEEYKGLRLQTSNQKRATGIIQRKQALLAQLEQDYTKILGYNALDWTIASVFRLADLYKEFADTLYAAPEPEGLDEEEYDMYVTQIEDLGLKYENIAISRYEKTVEQTRQLKVTNEWSRRALESINKYKPAEYPLFKEELTRTDLDPKFKLDARVPEVR